MDVKEIHVLLQQQREVLEREPSLEDFCFEETDVLTRINEPEDSNNQHNNECDMSETTREANNFQTSPDLYQTAPKLSIGEEMSTSVANVERNDLHYRSVEREEITAPTFPEARNTSKVATSFEDSDEPTRYHLEVQDPLKTTTNRCSYVNSAKHFVRELKIPRRRKDSRSQETVEHSMMEGISVELKEMTFRSSQTCCYTMAKWMRLSIFICMMMFVFAFMLQLVAYVLRVKPIVIWYQVERSTEIRWVQPVEVRTVEIHAKGELLRLRDCDPTNEPLWHQAAEEFPIERSIWDLFTPSETQRRRSEQHCRRRAFMAYVMAFNVTQERARNLALDVKSIQILNQRLDLNEVRTVCHCYSGSRCRGSPLLEQDYWDTQTCEAHGLKY